MARPLRLELAGALYHVTSRGDGREDIFLSAEDRVAWLETLAEVCKRFNWVCHAYCQMTNPYRLRSYLSGQHTMAAIAKYFGVHYTTVSRLVKAYEAAQK